MRCLVKKYPVNAHKPENNVIWYPPWDDNDEQGRPATLEGFQYAMCENAPEPQYDEFGTMIFPTIENFTVTEHTREIPSESGEEGSTITQRYWTAEFTTS